MVKSHCSTLYFPKSNDSSLGWGRPSDSYESPCSKHHFSGFRWTNLFNRITRVMFYPCL
jgi:hypothetical protein